MGECLISWKSKKQATVSRSSTEAEYRALNTTGGEIIWILKILDDLQVSYSLLINLHCDNNAAILISANPVFHERTKHFEIDLFNVRERVMAGTFKINKIDTTEQPADIFTKGLGVSQHNYLCDKLGLINLFGN